jgi:hypothetical protein
MYNDRYSCWVCIWNRSKLLRKQKIINLAIYLQTNTHYDI